MKSKSKAPKKNQSHKNRNNLELVSTYQPFIEQVQKMRERLGIPKGGFKTQSEGVSWCKRKSMEADNLVVLAHFTKDLAKKFNLPESYRNALNYYILQNDFFLVPGSSYTVGPWDSGEKLTEARYVPFRVYAKLTDEDLKKIKKEVNKHFGRRLPSFKNIRDLERKLEVEKLTREGELDAVTYQHQKMKPEDIAERVLGRRSKKKEIPNIINGLRKTRINRFGKK